jgi:phosphoglycolate phosphatase
VRLVVYDLDGTLADTLEDLTASANHMLRALGRPLVAASDVRGYVGRGIRELVGRCLETQDDRELSRALDVYREHYGRHLLDRSRLHPGARELLDYFEQRGRRQAVITNKPDPYSTQLLEGLGVSGYFSDIIAGNGPYPKKPDPASLRALMERHGAAQADTVLIGDSGVDVEAGRRAGVLSVAVRHGFGAAAELAAAHPDELVDDFTALLRLAQSRGW